MRRALKITFFSSLLFTYGIWLFFQFNVSFLPKEGESATLYANQCDDALDQLFYKAIREAKESIHLIVYALTDPKILKVLEKKAAEGIDIHIICDAKTHSKKVKGAECLFKKKSGLMHRKILVIDKKYVFMGSANFTAESLHVDDNLVASFYSEELSECILTMEKGEMTIGGQKVEFWPIPQEKQKAKERLLNLIADTERQLLVGMFTWTAQEFTDAIIAASKKEVEIEIALDRKTAEGASKKSLQQLAALSTISQGTGLFHHKFALLDRKTLVMGSVNWTNGAFSKNEESLIIIHNLTSKQIQKLDNLWHAIQCTSASPRN